MSDLIERQAAIEAVSKGCEEWRGIYAKCEANLLSLPSAQSTLCGYDIEHLILIANVLRKENLPPERVAEALNDIRRIVEIVSAEFAETLRKAVEQCKS